MFYFEASESEEESESESGSDSDSDYKPSYLDENANIVNWKGTCPSNMNTRSRKKKDSLDPFLFHDSSNDCECSDKEMSKIIARILDSG